MKYDFTKLRRAFAESGHTYESLAEQVTRQSGRKFHFSTLEKALKRDSAHQITAKALAKSLRVPYADLVPPEEAMISNGKKSA